MLWVLIIIPFMSLVASGDELVSGIGFIIISLATLINRYKKYNNMNDKIESAMSLKQSIVMLFAGGAASLTATNVISLFGMVLTAMGLVFVFLNWLVAKRNFAEGRRRNDLLERELDWKIGEQKKVTAAELRKVRSGNGKRYSNGKASGNNRPQ